MFLFSSLQAFQDTIVISTKSIWPWRWDEIISEGLLKKGQRKRLNGNRWLNGHLLLTMENGSVLTRGAHRRCGRGTAVDIEPQWLRGSWWQGLTCSTWGSGEGPGGRLSLWGCQGRAEGGARLWRLTTGQSGQSPSAYLEWKLHSDMFIIPATAMCVLNYSSWKYTDW